jgi:DNA-binding TFAR19-related protein (PDSD5 family)
LPTYVNAPKAVSPKRVIDLTTPGQWSEEQERLEREALAAASPSRDEIFDQQLADEAVERLNQARASNE